MTDWTPRYHDWTGSFTELVKTANAILQDDFPDREPLTERTARHYQNVGVLGKGEKEGRSARFALPDLVALVNAKAMAKDVGLKMVSALSQTYGTQEVHQEMQTAQASANAGVSSSAQAAVAAVAALVNKYADGGSVCAPAPVQLPGQIRWSDAVAGHGAQAVIRGGLRATKGTEDGIQAVARGGLRPAPSDALLRGQADVQVSTTEGRLGDPAPFAPMVMNVQSPSASFQAASSQRLFSHHTPTSWLTVAVDEQAAQAAPSEERQAAVAALQALAHRLNQE